MWQLKDEYAKMKPDIGVGGIPYPRCRTTDNTSINSVQVVDLLV